SRAWDRSTHRDPRPAGPGAADRGGSDPGALWIGGEVVGGEVVRNWVLRGGGSVLLVGLLLAAMGFAAAPEAAKKPAEPPKVPVIVNPIDGAEMVVVPAGEFRMGSDFGQEDEKPMHAVKVKGFRIYKTEVTNAQYARFLAAT